MVALHKAAEQVFHSAAKALDFRMRRNLFVRDIDFQHFSDSRLHQNACVRSLEVIGEAASKTSAQYKLSNDHLPWKQMISLRNRLIHGYNETHLDIVWSIIKSDLPVLVDQLVQLIPEE